MLSYKKYCHLIDIIVYGKVDIYVFNAYFSSPVKQFTIIFFKVAVLWRYVIQKGKVSWEGLPEAI